MGINESAYYGSIKDGLKSVASGGAATAVSKKFIEEGGVVFGVKYSADYKSAEYCRVDRVSDLEALKGSKYIFSNKKMEHDGKNVSVFEVVADELRIGNKVLFIGLGCDVFGLHQFLSKSGFKTDNLYTIDLICHGPTFPYIQKAVIEGLEEKYNSPITLFSVKNKKRGWMTPSMYAKFANGKEYCKPFYDTDFGYAFDHFSSSGCWDCKFKGNHHSSDLTIGDHWGISEKDSGFDKYGVSALITRSDKGNQLIGSLGNSFNLYPCELQQIVDDNPRYETSRAKDLNHDIFAKTFREKGLHAAVLEHRGAIKTILLPVKRVVLCQ